MITRRLIPAAAVLGAATLLVSAVPGLAQDAPEERDRSAFESFRLSLRNQLWAMGDRRA